MTGALYLFVREGIARDVSPKQPGALSSGRPSSQPSPSPSPSGEVDEAIITMGEGGGSKVFPYWLYASTSVEENTFTEIKRETTPKRVENPDDSSQYVMVEQIDKLYLQNKNNPKDQRTLELNNPK